MVRHSHDFIDAKQALRIRREIARFARPLVAKSAMPKPYLSWTSKHALYVLSPGLQTKISNDVRLSDDVLFGVPYELLEMINRNVT